MDYIFSKKSQCKLCEIERKHARVPLSLAEEVLTVYRSNMFSKIVRIFRSVILIFYCSIMSFTSRRRKLVGNTNFQAFCEQTSLHGWQYLRASHTPQGGQKGGEQLYLYSAVQCCTVLYSAVLSSSPRS